MKLINNTLSVRSLVRIIPVLTALLFTVGAVSAQLINVPLERATPVSKKLNNSAGRTKSSHPLVLPFWDDFSFTPINVTEDTLAGFPLDSLWLNSTSVWVNSGVGINPPSVNVATLDGVDSIGVAYSTDPQANGVRDRLISQPIDLSTARVLPAERSSVFLSFFYQWKGNGEPPDSQDHFRVEFLAKVGEKTEWVSVATISPTAGVSDTIFYDTLIQVLGDQFFHNKFQFSFVNYGRLGGPFDTWNIDYVYLDKGRSAGPISFQDGAFASSVGPLFGAYYAVPDKHFDQSKLLSNVKLDVFNLRPAQSNADPYGYRTWATVTSYFPNETVSTNTVLLTPDEESIPTLKGFTRYTIETLDSNKPDPSLFDSEADSALVDLTFRLASKDANFFVSNDTVSGHYTIKDFYAYDDGSAEYAVVLNEPDDQVVVRFDMIHTEEDKLIAIDVYIPRYSVGGFGTTEFFVMDNVNGFPGDVVSRVTGIIRRTDRDRFQRILLSKPVNVAGSFFIGWRGSATYQLKVGKDSETNHAEKIYVNAFGTWKQNTDVQGTIMIRPVFGDSEDPIQGIEDKGRIFTAYPNPSEGMLIISGRPDRIELISLSGQGIPITQIEQDELIIVSTPENVSGLYVLKLYNGSAVEMKKIIFR